MFDPDRVSGLEGALDAVCPIAFVGVAVMGVEDRAVVIEKIEGRAGRQHRLPHRRNLGEAGKGCEETVYARHVQKISLRANCIWRGANVELKTPNPELLALVPGGAKFVLF